MQHFGFRSVFAKLFASVMLALILFAVAMVLLTQLVHDKDAGIRSEVVATQILGQIDPFLSELNVAVSNNNRLQARFMLAVVKKSFDIFDESLQAKMGIYDDKGHLLMQTDNSDLPLELPAMPSLMARVFPSFSDTPLTHQAQVYSSTGYTLLYESRLPAKKPVLSAALNLFTGTLLLLIIMAGVLWWIARTMTWRINQLSQQMVELGDGDFSVRVNARGNDEIASLATGFNQAAQKIEHLIDANNLLLAHASHELRTPITRIRLQIEMMDMLAEVMPTQIKAKFDKRAEAINRDLSGLNDLVESILLVSRLDAGHVMQQVERLDLYDLVNQERQHYSEATLVGEHIVIDGQPSMLTHLIRNLLNNAMLHGIPPVTVLLYGVQSIEEADGVPEYLFQSVIDSSFAEYDTLEHSDFEAISTDELPVPMVYRNGETTIDEANDTFLSSTNNNSQSNDFSAALTPNNAVIAADLPPAKTQPALAVQNLDPLNDESNKATLVNTSNDVDNPNRLNSLNSLSHDNDLKGYHKLSVELTDKLKKAMWRSVTDEPLAIDDFDETLITTTNNNSTDENLTSDSLDKAVDSATSTPRKESIFKKHLKKSKAEPLPPAPNYAVLAVIDEGSGIPEDKREEIFSPFVRLQQKKKGSGLGLSLVSQIVSAHQGRIITDTINGHTRFLVIIPVKHDPHYNYKDSFNLQNKS